METGPLIVIVGPTASGKTALALDCAERFDGEVICADSRTVYKGLDIGTAKPTADEQTRIPHHLLDIVSPDEPFTVADFKHMAQQAINDITGRGKLPIMVGGSGLYVDAVLYDFQFAPQDAKRDPVNPRHIDRGVSSSRSFLRANTLIVGIEISREVLEESIKGRVDDMVEAGLIGEARWLFEHYPSSKAADAPGYKALRGYIQGLYSLEEAKALFIRNDMQLARRQRTWFKRNKSIHWVSNRDKAVEIITTFLNKSIK